MRYSLLSCFRGALLGLALGEELGTDSWTQHSAAKFAPSAPAIGTAHLQSWRPGLGSQGKDPSAQPFPRWSKQAVLGVEALIRSGNGDIQTLSKLLAPPCLAPNGAHPSLGSPQSAVNGAELAIALLPMALFFHDDEIKLRRTVSQLVLAWNGDAEVQAEVWAVAYAIALALKQRLVPANLIDQTIASLRADVPASMGSPAIDRKPQIVVQLERVQTLLDQGANLQTAMAELSQLPHSSTQAIGLAFYCFLSTPDDLRLAVMRAARAANMPHLVCGITGAIAGAYNGMPGIPLAWSMNAFTAAPILGSGKSVPDLYQLAARLLAVWSGAYDSTAFAEQVPVIAAPDVIRPR